MQLFKKYFQADQSAIELYKVAVKGDPAANMTNVRRGLNRRATQIDTHFATLKGNKIPHGAR